MEIWENLTLGFLCFELSALKDVLFFLSDPCIVIFGFVFPPSSALPLHY